MPTILAWQQAIDKARLFVYFNSIKSRSSPSHLAAWPAGYLETPIARGRNYWSSGSRCDSACVFCYKGGTAINQKDTTLINERIHAREVRAIDLDGTQLGILNTREAMRIATERGCDLVCVAPEAKPPVCKIMDYGRHRFEAEKKLREARKKQHTVSLKELTVSYKIGEHDFQVRLKSIRKFIGEGNKVKVTVRFRGREMQHSNLAQALLMKFATEAGDIALIEKDPRLEGRTLYLILSPIKKEKPVNA